MTLLANTNQERVFNFSCDLVMDINYGTPEIDDAKWMCKAKVMEEIFEENIVRFVIEGFTESDINSFKEGDVKITFNKDTFEQDCFKENTDYVVKFSEGVTDL